MIIELEKRKKQRVQSIKEVLLQNPPGICSERARIYTQVYKEKEGLPKILLRAESLKSYFENMTIYLGDQDIIPGYQASKPRTAPIFPEYSWEWIYKELDRFNKRKYDRFTIDNRTKEELREILPQWKNKSLFDTISLRQTDEVKKASEIGVISWMGQAISGEGHIVVDHELALTNGFAGLIRKTRKYSSQLRLYEPEDLNKRDFYDAAEITLQAGINFSKRLSEHAGELAEKTDNNERKRELLLIKDACSRIPAQPPETFYEALLMVWFVHLIQQIETNGHSTSLGRFDQYIFPFYKKDIDSDKINRQQALEYLEHFYLKLFSVIKVRPEKHSRTQSGYPMYQNLVVGGQTIEGKDATNELSYMCLSALADVRLPEPNFYIRVHENSPEEFLMDAMHVVKLGIGMPAFVNDKVIVRSLIKRGITYQDALNYSTMGCLEVQVPGKWGYRANGKSKVSLLKILELVLNDGKDPLTGTQLKKGRGDISEIESFEQLFQEWNDHVEYYTKIHVTADNINDKYLSEMVPNAFCSVFVRDCLVRGKHINEGGAIYDMTSGALVGLPNIGNAFAALKKLVYEDKVLTGKQIKKALEDNYEGKDGTEIQKIILNRAPKYGEDIDYVDNLTKTAVQKYIDIIPDFKNMRYKMGPIGGNYYPSTVTISANVAAGMSIGATPDGRKAFEPTADGVSPFRGTGGKGLTAIIQSVCKLPTVEMTGGQLLNLRVTNSSIKTEIGLKKLLALIQTLFDMEGWHVQINCVSTKMLKDAVKHPENYKDLVVRVAGYSALFVSLDPVLQKDIIKRMEYDV